MKLPRHHVLLMIVAGLVAALYVTWACAGKGLSQDTYKKLLGKRSTKCPSELPRKPDGALNSE